MASPPLGQTQPHPAPESNQPNSGQMRLLKPAIIYTHSIKMLNSCMLLRAKNTNQHRLFETLIATSCVVEGFQHEILTRRLFIQPSTHSCIDPSIHPTINQSINPLSVNTSWTKSWLLVHGPEQNLVTRKVTKSHLLGEWGKVRFFLHLLPSKQAKITYQ